MLNIHKILDIMASQIKKPDVKLPTKSNTPQNKITDDNQAINLGVINEKFDISMGSTGSARKTS